MPEERLPTNIRALMVLEALSKQDRALTPTEIGVEIGLPKQSAHRLCMALMEHGFLTYAEDQRRMRPSLRTRNMSQGLLHASQFHTERRLILKEVARHVRETVNFSVPSEEGMRYRDRVETDWAFRIQLPVGSDVPFHCTASGKTYLANLAPQRQKRLLENLTLDKLTENTIFDIDALRIELKQIKRQGYAVDNEEFMDGMVALAVPIFDPMERYVASLAFHGPRQRLSDQTLIDNLAAVQRGVAKLKALMFDANVDA